MGRRAIWRSGGTLLVVLILGAICAVPSSMAAPPSNDDFANAQALGGPLPVTTTTSNVGATSQQGDPGHGPMPAAGHSVWFTWEATSTEVVTVEACSTDIRPILGVYLGDQLGALTEVAGSTWDPGPGCELGIEGRATFRAIAGKKYSVEVDANSYQASPGPPVVTEGAVDLRIYRRPPPANDDFSQAETIHLDSGGVPAPNFGATKEPGEPAKQGDEGGASVWFEFTAPRNGGALLQVNGGQIGHTSLLGVYTGTSVGELAAVPVVPMWNGSAIAFPIEAGVTYRIAVDGKYDPTTESAFMDDPDINLSSFPGNDDFEDAFPLTNGPMGGSTGSFGLGNVGASKEFGEPDHAGNHGGSSVWFSWKAQGSGSAELTTCGTDFHTLLAVYVGSEVSALTPVAASSNPESPACNIFSQGPYQLAFDVEAGTEYMIAVDGYDGAWGGFGLQMATSRESLGSIANAARPPAKIEASPTLRVAVRPRTRIEQRHVNSHRRVAVFHLGSNENGSRFLCWMDSGPPAACHATVRYRNLKFGRHTFRSEAVNPTGERDSTPAAFRFTIKRP